MNDWDNVIDNAVCAITSAVTIGVHENILTMLRNCGELLKKNEDFSGDKLAGYEYAISLIEKQLEDTKGWIKYGKDGQRKEDLGSADQGDQKPLRSSGADGEPDGGKQPESIL